MYFVEVEVLRRNGRRERTHRLQGCTPKTGNHIHGKCQRAEREEERGNARLLLILIIVGELDATKEIDTEEGKDANPKGEEGFAVENAPTVSQVCHREELEGECQFQETEGHLHLVHPATALGSLLQHRGEEGEEGKGKRQRKGETKHTNGGCEHRAATCTYFYKEETDDRTCAREAHERECERHEEDREHTRSLFSLAVNCCTPRRGKRDFKASEEACREDYQHQEEEDVEEGVCR